MKRPTAAFAVAELLECVSIAGSTRTQRGRPEVSNFLHFLEEREIDDRRMFALDREFLVASWCDKAGVGTIHQYLADGVLGERISLRCSCALIVQPGGKRAIRLVSPRVALEELPNEFGLGFVVE
jgi:hypothetical protein